MFFVLFSCILNFIFMFFYCKLGVSVSYLPGHYDMK